MRHIIYILLLLGITTWADIPAMAQDDNNEGTGFDFGVEYTADLQTDFHRNYNLMNLLQLRATLPLSKAFAFEASTITLGRTKRDAVVEDQLGFSNIDGPNTLLAPAVVGLWWHINNKHSLFAGVRNINEDYFSSDAAELFVNSSPCDQPPLWANFSICDYPYASMGLHYNYDSEKIGVKATLYNGAGYNKFWGRENAFRFCPNSDGVMLMAQGEYKHNDSHYFIGGAAHYGRLEDMEGRKVRPVAWAYAEQRLNDKLSLIGAYSRALHSGAYCTDFVGVGGKLSLSTVDLGLYADYAHFEDDEEWALEITCQIPITDWCYIQPTLHLIKNTEIKNAVGVLRFGVEF